MLSLATATPACAEWTYLEDFSDPFQAFHTRAAQTVNDAGYVLHLYRNPVGRVYALISLPDDAPALIETGPVAVLTPEGFDPKPIEARSERGRVVEYAFSDGRRLRDRLWHGEGPRPEFGTFHDLLEAPSVTATLTHADSSTTDQHWSMDGAGLSIAQALGIQIDGVAAGEEWDAAAAQALLAAMTVCQFPKLDVLCVQKVTTCSARISEDRDIEGFEVCVAEDG
ncbi:MAG: hypothetical protein AAFP16_05530 [Pseudomonadota bacterium]